MRRAARPALFAFLALSLAACQTEVAEAPVAGTGGSASPSSTATSEASKPGTTTQPSAAPTPALTGVMVAAEALSAFFVASFESYEAEAHRLRTQDDRYLKQKNQWSWSGGTLYDSYPLASARFEYAHAAGLTGAGQTVSVVDTGFLPSHETLTGADLRFPLGPTPVDAHGTGVASIIAGWSSEMTGVAPGTTLALSYFGSDAALATATRDALERGAVAQNNSWGYELDATPGNLGLVFGPNSAYLDALKDYAQQGVVVFAASNDATRTRASIMEALPALVPELERGWLSVVSAVPDFDAERVLSADLLSAGCLDTARWCLAADGTWFVADSASPRAYGFASGTSYAAPQVSGALALLAEAFPDLTPHELRARLLASADNGFFPHEGAVELAPGFFHGYGRDFGHGFLDVRAALLPIGPTILPAQSGGGAPAGEPILLAGAAVGDAVVRSLAAQDVLVTDALGGGFTVGARALVAQALPQPLMADRLASFGDAGPGALPDPGTDILDALSGSRMRFSRPDGALEVSLVAPGSGSEDFGFGLRRVEEDGRGRIGLGFSVIRDGTGSVGLTSLLEDGRGAWAATLDLEATARLAGATELSFFGQVGLMGAPESDAYASVSEAEFASFGMGLERQGAFRRGDRLSLGMTLPTAVTSGSVEMTLPVARAGGVVSFAPVEASLAPRDREMRLSLSYSAPMGDRWSIVAEGVHAVNRGHVSGETDTGALLGLQARF